MRSDRGSGTVVMMLVVAVIVFVGVGSTSVGLVLAERERASIASEAAALAAAVATYPPAGGGDPLSAAREMAAANGASLISCRCPVDSSIAARIVEVAAEVSVSVPLLGTVTVGRSARAEFDPGLWLGS